MEDRATAWSVYFMTGDTALLEKTPIYLCQSYFDDDNSLVNCSCGGCQ